MVNRGERNDVSIFPKANELFHFRWKTTEVLFHLNFNYGIPLSYKRLVQITEFAGCCIALKHLENRRHFTALQTWFQWQLQQ